MNEKKSTENVPHPVSFHCFLLYCVGITIQIAILCFSMFCFFCMFVNQRGIYVFADTQNPFSLLSPYFFCYSLVNGMLAKDFVLSWMKIRCLNIQFRLYLSDRVLCIYFKCMCINLGGCIWLQVAHMFLSYNLILYVLQIFHIDIRASNYLLLYGYKQHFLLMIVSSCESTTQHIFCTRIYP